MNQAISDFRADDFREVFLQSIFDYLNQNAINLNKIEDVIERYQENKIAHSINMAFSMAIERTVDKFLLTQKILKEEELGTELDSEFSIQGNPSTGNPIISSKYKLKYKKENLDFIVNCHFKLNEIYDNEKIDQMIGKITLDIGKQLNITK